MKADRMIAYIENESKKHDGSSVVITFLVDCLSIAILAVSSRHQCSIGESRYSSSGFHL